MSAKVHLSNGQAYFHCPGCGETHGISIDPQRARQMSDGTRPCWTFNGSVESPTFTPSVNYTGHCHFTVTNGQSQFYQDCAHQHKGETLDLPAWEDPA